MSPSVSDRTSQVGLSAGGDSPNSLCYSYFFNPFIEVSDRLTLPFHLHYKYECNIRGSWDQQARGRELFLYFLLPWKFHSIHIDGFRYSAQPFVWTRTVVRHCPSTITDDPRFYRWGTFCPILIPRDAVTIVCCNTFQLQGLPTRLFVF